MRYDRTVIGYHGCDREAADCLVWDTGYRPDWRYSAASRLAEHRRRWSENRSPSGRSVRHPLTFQGLQSLQPALAFRGLWRL